MQVEVGGLRILRRPLCVGMPCIRSALKCAGLPRRLLAVAMQVITKEWSLDVLAELAGGFVSGERNDADLVALGAPPLSVIPRPGDDEVGVLRIVLLRVAEDLPRTPRIFLVPEAGHVEIGNRGGV